MKQKVYFIIDFQILVLKEEEWHTQIYTSSLNKTYI